MLTEKERRQIEEYFRDKPVIKAWIFGSEARDEARLGSDLDLLIRPDYSQRLGWKFFSFKRELEEILGREVDVVSERYLKDFAKPSVEKDKRLIYERSE